ncbi:MAG: P-loop NTPase [Brevinemataceae bacterium]
MTEQQINDIISSSTDELIQKKKSEILSIDHIIQEDGLLKFQIHFSNLSLEEKKSLRNAVKSEFEKRGVDVLVNIIVNEPSKPANQPQMQKLIPEELFKKFKKIIAVYSSKGGVGKSTVAAQLVRKFSQNGLKTAIIDLDIYGPSIPRILGIRDKVEAIDNKFIPSEVEGIHLMSVGLLIPQLNTPLVWRAPIVNNVVRQLFVDTNWENDYDLLVIDMPPGTGDIPISVCQNIPLDGIVIVSTPQGVAMEDTIKGISMLDKFDRPVLGCIYNMGSLVCPSCESTIPLFPYHKEFTNELQSRGIEIIADLPLDTSLAESLDQGNSTNFSEDSLWNKEFSKAINYISNTLEL